MIPVKSYVFWIRLPKLRAVGRKAKVNRVTTKCFFLGYRFLLGAKESGL